MKKAIALVLCLMMAISTMALSAAAGYKADKEADPNITLHEGKDDNTVKDGSKYGMQADGKNGQTIGTKTLPVKIEANNQKEKKPVWAVSCSTTELKFTYNGGAGTLIWNPETLRYEDGTTTGTTTPGWNDAGIRNITITNYSNVPIKVETRVNTGAQTYGVNVAATMDDYNIKSADDADVMVDNVGQAQTGTITVSVNGVPSQPDISLAEIATLTIEIKDAR